MFSKEGECVCVHVSGKNMRDIFFCLAFLGRKGLLREKGVVGVTCFVTFLFVFGGL